MSEEFLSFQTKIERNEIPTTTRYLQQVQDYQSSESSKPSKYVDETIDFFFGENTVIVPKEEPFKKSEGPDFRLPERKSFKESTSSPTLIKTLETSSFTKEIQSHSLSSSFDLNSESLLATTSRSSDTLKENNQSLGKNSPRGRNSDAGEDISRRSFDEHSDNRQALHEPRLRPRSVIKFFNNFGRNSTEKKENPLEKKPSNSNNSFVLPEKKNSDSSIPVNFMTSSIPPVNFMMTSKKASVAEFIKTNRLNETDLQKIKGFGVDDPIEDDFIVKEKDIGRLMQVYYPSFSYLTVENLLCDKIPLYQTPYPKT